MSETNHDPYAPPASQVPEERYAESYTIPDPIPPATDVFPAPEPMVASEPVPTMTTMTAGLSGVPPDVRVPVEPSASLGVGRVVEEVVAWLKTLASAAVYATLIVTFGFQVARVEG